MTYLDERDCRISILSKLFVGIVLVVLIGVAAPINTASAAPATPAKAPIVGGAIVLGIPNPTNWIPNPLTPINGVIDCAKDPVSCGSDIIGAGKKVIGAVWDLKSCIFVAGSAATTANPFLVLANPLLPSCVKAIVKAVGAGVGLIASGPIKDMINEMNRQFLSAGKSMAEFVLQHELGSKNGMASPKVNTPWFVGQESIMRSIGLYVVIPMLLLVILQSIVRGSMFFLLRAALIMLPTAVVGSTVLVLLTQRMLDIADDFTLAISARVTDVGGYGQQLQDTFTKQQEHPELVSLFMIFWILLFIGAGIIIYLELLFRQTGVYLAAFFLPLAFAALVWPPSAKWAKRLVELLIGLIFSKVFIAAAISLGIAAVAHTGVAGDAVAAATASASGASQDDVAAATQTEATMSAVAAGAALLVMAAFAGVKILAVAPGAMSAAEHRIVNTSAVWGKGQVVQAAIGWERNRRSKKLANMGPSKEGFTNVSPPPPTGGTDPSSNGGDPSGSPVPVGGGGGNGGKRSAARAGTGRRRGDHSDGGSQPNGSPRRPSHRDVPVPPTPEGTPQPVAGGSTGGGHGGGHRSSGGTATARAAGSSAAKRRQRGTPLRVKGSGGVNGRRTTQSNAGQSGTARRGGHK